MPSDTVNEALGEISESKAALSKILWALIVAIATAVGNALGAIAPDITNIALQFLPVWAQHSAGSVITALVLAVAAWLLRLGASNHKAAVTRALVTEPSAELKALYEKNPS